MMAHGVSQRRACGFLELDRTSFRYRSMRPSDGGSAIADCVGFSNGKACG
jgi:hypothetical protein